jgi:hypothetical protein
MATIQTTLGALVQAEPALQAICALSLAAKAAYHVKKLAQLVAQETAHFHAERDRAIRELGTARDGGGYEIKPDGDTVIDGQNAALQAFQRRVTDLAAVPVTIAWGPITIDLLGDERVSAAQLLALGPLCADPDGEAGTV